MLYLGIDLHRVQMTVSLRNENGDVDPSSSSQHPLGETR